MNNVLYRELSELRNELKHYDNKSTTRSLSPCAVFDSDSQKYFIRIISENTEYNGQVSITYHVLKKQRVKGKRLMTLKSVAYNMRKIGFKKFVVLLE